MERLAPKTRSLLALLLLRANETVSLHQITYELWEKSSPSSAESNVRTYITALRRFVEPAGATSRIRRVGSGYSLQLGSESVDLLAFRELHAEGMATAAKGDPSAAMLKLDKAGALWRDTALADVPLGPVLRPWKVALDEELNSFREDQFEVLLALGQNNDAIRRLRLSTAANPLRERQRGQLMLALFRTGCRVEAVREYHSLRRALMEELGVEPGAALQQLHTMILRADPALVPTPEGPVNLADARF
jgi:DNA-binding SARP family transcriptional activator